MCGDHWRDPANTTEPFMSGGDAACCQIIFDQLSVFIVPIQLWLQNINRLLLPPDSQLVHLQELSSS